MAVDILRVSDAVARSCSAFSLISKKQVASFKAGWPWKALPQGLGYWMSGYLQCQVRSSNTQHIAGEFCTLARLWRSEAAEPVGHLEEKKKWTNDHCQPAKHLRQITAPVSVGQVSSAAENDVKTGNINGIGVWEPWLRGCGKHGLSAAHKVTISMLFVLLLPSMGRPHQQLQQRSR